MKVVIFLGSPTDMYLEIYPGASGLGNLTIFSQLCSNTFQLLFSLFIYCFPFTLELCSTSFETQLCSQLLFSSALFQYFAASRFLSSAPIFRSCSVSLDFVLHCSSSCGSQGSAAVQMHRIAIMVIVIIITILIIVLIIVIVIITSLS